jgi:hypothetical protein
MWGIFLKMKIFIAIGMLVSGKKCARMYAQAREIEYGYGTAVPIICLGR